MFRKVCKIGLILSALVVWGGCVADGSETGANASVKPQTEMVVDQDATSKTALGLIFNMGPIDDRLDFDAGDREDWRYMIVTEPGTITINLNLDTAANIDGGWKIFDANNRKIYDQAFKPNQSYYPSEPLNVQRGVYYFQVYAVRGKSIYTVEAVYRSMQVVAPPPPPVDDPPVTTTSSSSSTKTSSSSSSRHHSGSGSTKSTNSDSKPDKTPKEDPKPAESSGTKIKGFIAVITEKPDGSAEITIRDVGKNKGVETGMVGYIEGTKIKIETTQCFPTSCRALIPASANPKSFKKGANVVFTVK